MAFNCSFPNFPIFDLTAYPAREFDGFEDPNNAEQATEIFAKEQIDKL